MPLKGSKMHSDEFKAAMRKRLKDSGFVPPNTTGVKQNLTEEQRQLRRDRIVKLNQKGFENKGGRCKFFQIDGIVLQGRYELYFYLNCEFKPVKCKPILTPFGWYTPDFELNNEYIEIKSTYTVKTCVQNGQYKKIKWVRDNIKRVKIIVIQESIVNEYLQKNKTAVI